MKELFDSQSLARRLQILQRLLSAFEIEMVLVQIMITEQWILFNGGYPRFFCGGTPSVGRRGFPLHYCYLIGMMRAEWEKLKRGERSRTELFRDGPGTYVEAIFFSAASRFRRLALTWMVTVTALRTPTHIHQSSALA